MPRQRNVYPTAEIPHLWAHARQQSARNPQGNLFFRDATIYSYRESWPLARIYTRRDGARLVLSNSASYSITTTGHQFAANRAVSNLQRIAVPCVSLDYETKLRHGENIAYLQRVAADHLKAAQRATSVHRVEWRRRVAFDALTACGHYMGFFGIRRKAPVIPVAEWHAAEERAQRIENPDPETRAARERANMKRTEAKRAREALHQACARTDWRLHGAFGVSFPWRRRADIGACMLRLSEDAQSIETSLGARVPVAAAPMVWRAVERARTEGSVYGERIRRYGIVRIGDYPLDRIDADGTLHAGCHTIPYSELSAMARRLGLS